MKKKSEVAVAPKRTCSHNDPANWLDVHCDRPGWIKTLCRQCSGFIGYRDARPKKSRRQTALTSDL